MDTHKLDDCIDPHFRQINTMIELMSRSTIAICLCIAVLYHWHVFNYVVFIYKVVLNSYRQVFIWYVSVWCSFVRRSLKFGALIFLGQ